MPSEKELQINSSDYGVVDMYRMPVQTNREKIKAPTISKKAANSDSIEKKLVKKIFKAFFFLLRDSVTEESFLESWGIFRNYLIKNKDCHGFLTYFEKYYIQKHKSRHWCLYGEEKYPV